LNHIKIIKGVLKMKKLILEYYGMNRDGSWDFKKVFFKEYYFNSKKSNDEIIQFMEILRSYEIVYIYTWKIEEV
jgi:bisphosphoglycerate-independent phosphoglycerate mutase (AlkP superfamily)